MALSKMAKFVNEMEAWEVSEYSSSDEELDFVARREDYIFLKYHKIKKSQSMVQPRTTAPMKAKKKVSTHVIPKKVYRDFDLYYKPELSSKNNLNILMFGS